MAWTMAFDTPSLSSAIPGAWLGRLPPQLADDPLGLLGRFHFRQRLFERPHGQRGGLHVGRRRVHTASNRARTGHPSRGFAIKATASSSSTTSRSMM